jgi:Domain of unknown function (DUF1707)
MTDDGGIRASDSDRENVVEILRDAYTAGRLTLEEFDERTTAAFATKTWGGLRDLTRDLPHGLELGRTKPSPAARPPRPEDRVPIPAGQARRRFSPVLPILVIWLGIALTAREPAAFIPVIIVMLVLLRFVAGGARHHSHHNQPSHHPDDHDQPRGGPPA